MTKSFDIAKINSDRAPCLSSSGGYQRGRSLLNCHVVSSGTFCWITQVRNISHPWDFGKSFIYSFCTRRNLVTLFLIHRRFCYFTCVTSKLNNTLTEFRFPRAAANSRRSIFFNVYKTDFSIIGWRNVYKKSSRQNQDKGFGENFLNEVCLRLEQRKKGKPVKLHLLVLP